MPKLTLYVFFCEGFDPRHTVRSVRTREDDQIIIRHERDLSREKIETDWVGFLMADEKLDDRLSPALPVFLESDYECLVMFKKTGGDKFYFTPRFFRNKVIFDQGTLLPVNIKELRSTRVLNGLIVDAPKGDCNEEQHS